MSIEHKSVSKQPEKQGKRTFHLSAATRIGLCLLILSPILTSCSGSKPPITEPIPASASNPEHFYQDNLVLNKEGLPVGYMLEDRTVALFNVNEVKAMRLKAISSREPQILAMFSYNKEDDSNREISTWKERPTLLNLPEDVLSEEELAINGVRIIQADNTTLSIRKQAFAEGGPLAELAGKGGSEKLTIVLVDGSVVAKGFMKDPKYDEVKDLLPDYYDNVKAYRLEKIKEFKNNLESLRKKLARDPYALNLHSILQLKGFIYAYEKDIVTDNQLLEQKWAESYTAGLYFGRKLQQRTIFIAVGKRETVSKKVVYFDPNGQVLLRDLDVDSKSSVFLNNRPNSDYSYPNPKDFPLYPRTSPDDPIYNMWAGGLKLSLEHEVQHDILIAQAVSEGKEANKSEHDADAGAGQRLQDAWDKWEKSGFTDNSGYSFVFSLPYGGYILTYVPKLNKTLGLIA